MAKLALTPHNLVEARELTGGAYVELDHFVESFGDATRLPGPFLRQAHIAFATFQGDQGGQDLPRLTIQCFARAREILACLRWTAARTLGFGAA